VGRVAGRVSTDATNLGKKQGAEGQRGRGKARCPLLPYSPAPQLPCSPALWRVDDEFGDLDNLLKETDTWQWTPLPKLRSKPLRA